MKATLVVLALCLALVSAHTTSNRELQEYQSMFTKWMTEHQKSYSSDEFRYRFRVFQNNVDFVDSFNAESNGISLKINQFADLTNLEYRNLMLGYNAGLKTEETGLIKHESQVLPEALPASYDWRDYGAVTHVKNQGNCGSCWSFSTTGSTEGCHKITTGTLTSVSEQNLIDCSSNLKYGNHGCNGGLMTNAMKYIIDNGGIDTEASYPYTGAEGSCKYSTTNKGATLTSYTNVQSGSESDLQTKTYSGPVSVAIDASQASFQFYSSGVYYEPKCSSTNLDHGVLCIGWGHDNTSGMDYWIVKNSWGTSWGQQGYIWMARNKNNNCGIATEATLPHC